MPQINRIRVNNVKYNFGTQYYDDFVMRFNGKNTIYDLANGGGKSLLMLLLMQNMIPNCTLDDKQPIEKLFRQGSGNTCIHSLVEWKLESAFQKDGYSYMTTGFCARKGSKGETTDDSGQDMSGIVESVLPTSDSESASVEYFNYCIFYRQFGDNDIKNLPLASNGERITYNGLKAYLRELEKNDFNVSVKIFDRKGDYQQFISQYGIYESSWEIVRGINKTEGHVRTFFETNYKTSRKVVEDLLIEEIIQKSFNNSMAVDNDEGKMAKTLLDIKDKLVELSKKHDEISSYDSQIAALEEFEKYLLSYKELYSRKERTKNMLYDMLLACKAEVEKRNGLVDAKEKQASQNQEKIQEYKRKIAVAEVISEKNSLENVEKTVKETEGEKAVYDKNSTSLREQLTRLEAANDYFDYIEYTRTLNEMAEAMNNSMRESKDLIEELSALSVIYREQFEKKKASIEQNIDNMSQTAIEKEKQLEDVKEALSLATSKEAVNESLKEHTRATISVLEDKLNALINSCGIMLPDNIEQEYDKCVKKVEELTTHFENVSDEFISLSEQVIGYKGEIVASKNYIERLMARSNELSDKILDLEEDKEKIENFGHVYGVEADEDLGKRILETYKKMDRECQDKLKEIINLSEFIENTQNKDFNANSPFKKRLYDYLYTQYGDDVIDGLEWFKTLNVGQRRDLLKRAPFIQYSFVIKNDFDRIKSDEILKDFGRESIAFPIVSEQVLYDTKLEVNKELICYAMKDLTFLDDEGRREAELKKAREEKDNLQVKLDRLKDQAETVWEDYTFVVKYFALSEGLDINEEIKENEKALEDEEDKLKKLSELLRDTAEAVEISRINRDNADKELDTFVERKNVLERAREIYAELNSNQKHLQEYRGLEGSIREEVISARRNLDKASVDYAEVEKQLKVLKENLEKETEIWEKDFAQYCSNDDAKCCLSKDDVEKYVSDAGALSDRFYGLKQALLDKNGDSKDKQSLMQHLNQSKAKSRAAIEYKGYTLESMQQMYDNGELSKSDSVKLLDIKNDIKKNDDNIAKLYSQLESQSALMNRLQGSIAHSERQIIEQFGEYVEFECENPDTFISQHKEQLKLSLAEAKRISAEMKNLSDALKEILVWEKDLTRIVTEAGMTIPENIPSDFDTSKVDINRYEEFQKEFSQINKLEFKKKDEFNKNKQKLIDLLEGLHGEELATEIRLSVNMPEDVSQTDSLMDSLRETNTFIALERDRVSKGIEDMERIKDNFENRCIQTCSNIKTELDRLPKLSTITLEGEQINIISLMIPYVKEESYKERMSAYIDETILISEGIDELSERLKYIRNRLTWKRLFSVIVTDMNSVRINLYKRERIKEQSRYLRYEEAVGSTGQSQGIYIQFLIAIINYISNMNMSVKDGGIASKTIFIDNPFGAAKDIYIWEPIFKMLSTNHVQLIVPARGATPAITGRFEVNYILGQKLVDKRQQTVVVDYFSSTNESELEYTRMNYEQATFNWD